MNTVIVPYELIEKLFGTFIADNFNTIMAALMVIGFIVAGSNEIAQKKNWVKETNEKQEKHFQNKYGDILKDDPNKEWDPEKHTWIDKEEEARKERYRKYHEGQPPTFEEWRAQREKEKQEQK